jgi:hypothetical protein
METGGIDRAVESMERASLPTPRETTEAIGPNIGRELLHNLLIDTVRKPRRIEPPRQNSCELADHC